MLFIFLVFLIAYLLIIPYFSSSFYSFSFSFDVHPIFFFSLPLYVDVLAFSFIFLILELPNSKYLLAFPSCCLPPYS